MGIQLLDEIKQGDKVSFDVAVHHPLFDKKQDIWETCRDCHEGEEAVKAKKTRYLPMLSGQEPDEYNKYLLRAQFTGFTYRTVESYLGMLFRKGMDLEFYLGEKQNKKFDDYMQKQLKIVTEDGKSFYNFVHDLVEEIIITNRVGVLLDVPKLDPAVLDSMSLEDYLDRKIKPLFSMYKTESIINWHTETMDGQVIPTMFVLYEPRQQFSSKSLKVEEVDAYRILYLENWEDRENRQYKNITIAREHEHAALTVESVSYPEQNGKRLKHIPFFVFTDRGLDYRTVHNPMIKDLANVNLGHYRNSADYENELHFVGVKTLYFPGWDKRTFGDPRIGGALAGPKDSTPQLLEPSSDSSLRQALIDKTGMAATLGAERLSLRGKYVASAETARITQSSESAILANMVINLNEVLTRMLQMWTDWHKSVIEMDGGFTAEKTVKVILSNDFTEDTISGADALNWLQVLQSGGISHHTYFEMMKRREVYEPGWTYEKELAALEQTQMNFAASAGKEVIQGGTDNPFFTKLREQMEEAEEPAETESNSGEEGLSQSIRTRGRGADQTVPIRGTKARVRIS